MSQHLQDGLTWCWACKAHRAKTPDTLCPVCMDDPATRARWETATAEADIRRRQRESGAA